jgi:hypothetical protein
VELDVSIPIEPKLWDTCSEPGNKDCGIGGGGGNEGGGIEIGSEVGNGGGGGTCVTSSIAGGGAVGGISAYEWRVVATDGYARE